MMTPASDKVKILGKAWIHSEINCQRDPAHSEHPGYILEVLLAIGTK